jgi:hypothetical protein
MSLLVLYAVVTVFCAVANLPFLFCLLTRKELPMPVLHDYQPVIDELTSLTAAVAALKQSVDSAPSVQDTADTLAALQIATDGLKTAAGQ